MKILLANKFYYPRGGDCIYTINLEQLLLKRGHEVAIFAMQFPENLPSVWTPYFPSEVDFKSKSNPLKTALRPFGTSEVKQKFTQLIETFQPDVVHLNNIHSHLSPFIAKIAHKKGIKVVWTMHDYKLVCANSSHLRDRHICELCIIKKEAVIFNKCIKKSLMASFLGYFESQKWSVDKIKDSVDCFICPSNFMKNQLIKGGVNSEKLTVLNNFVNMEPKLPMQLERENYYCYVGRLSEEKGIETLLKVASVLPYHLKLFGDGDKKVALETLYNQSNIEFLGHQPWEQIKEVVSKSTFTVLPSECFDNNPLSAIESLMLGTPVLGANIGGIPELIDIGVTGALFESTNQLSLKNEIATMFENKNQFNNKHISELASDRFSSLNYYNRILQIYQA